MLTAEQLAFRSAGIGGSDARTIMYGEAKDWIELAAIKKGEKQPKFTKAQRRLMDMGIAMEPLALQWFGEDYRPLRQLLPDQLCATWSIEPLFRCIFDGVTEQEGVPVQCKFHTGEKTIEELADYYLPQLQHEMLVSEADKTWLAVVFGRWGAFKAIEVERDREFIDAYQMRALLFQHYWKTGELPPDMAALVPQAAKVVKLRDHQWPAGDNTIGPVALEWLNAKHYAEELDELGRKLKAQFPDDARSAKWVNGEGHGIIMKRNKAGTIALSAI